MWIEVVCRWLWKNVVARKALLRMTASAIISLVQYVFTWLEEQVKEEKTDKT